MSNKLSKKLIKEFHKTNDEITKAEKQHQKSINNIIEVVKPLVIEERKKGDGIGNWKIKNVEFLHDSYIDYKLKGDKNEYEWIEISEDEYYELYNDELRYGSRDSWGNKTKSKVKEEYIEEPEFKIIYYKRIEKRYEYLRVHVYESWRYGGEDWVQYDFLLSDIIDEKDLRKEKLNKLQNENNR